MKFYVAYDVFDEALGYVRADDRFKAFEKAFEKYAAKGKKVKRVERFTGIL